jgi:hypothetical protein
MLNECLQTQLFKYLLEWNDIPGKVPSIVWGGNSTVDDNVKRSQQISNLFNAGIEPTPEFFSQDFAKYNVTIEEGILTDTQKQSQFITLSALKTMGILPPEGDSLIIKNSNLHDKKKYKERLAAQAQAQKAA